jgi:tetratricopeptide (TPR) repeat protein/SAM-dependent methyltransferase
MKNFSVEQTFLKANLFLKKEEFHNASQLYLLILNKFPKNKIAQKCLINSDTMLADKYFKNLFFLYNNNLFESVINEINILTKKITHAPVLWNLLGSSLIAIEKFNDGIIAYEKLISINPNLPETYNNLGIAYQAIGNQKSAIDSFKNALNIKPSYANACFNMGNSYKNMHEYKCAIEYYKKTIYINPNFVEAYNNIGIIFQDKENYEEAKNYFKQAIFIKPNYAEAYFNLGNTLKLSYKYENAIYHYKKALEIKPKYAEAYNNLGNTFQAIGNHEEALFNYKQALNIKPKFAEIYNNIGYIEQINGKYESALINYNQALNIKSDYAEVYNNIGNIMQINNDYEASISNYNKALNIKPNYAEVYNNLGNAMHDNHDYEAAIFNYNQALNIDSNYAEAYYNLGNTLKANYNFETAIDSYKKALDIRPDYPEVYYNLGNILENIIFLKPNSNAYSLMIALLDNKKYSRPKDISMSIISLLKCEPNLKLLIKCYLSEKETQNLEKSISILSNIPLLIKLMCICPIADLEIELVLRNIRSQLLFSYKNMNFSQETLRFISALSLQCFTNEYIYYQGTKETEALEKLEQLVSTNLKNKKNIDSAIILILSSFKALNNYEWSNLLTNEASYKDVFIRQVLEPKIENNLKMNVPSLDEINNKISSKVRLQYEENPYPRWINFSLPFKPAKVCEIIKHLKLKIHNNSINHVTNPDILIAGCGTGQHSIETSYRFQNSNVLAIDLSLSSLAYAQRKSNELNLNNIKFMHGDILDFSKLDQRYDIVESVGVLHHMENPFDGWKSLVNCLKPGGLMKIGLYSKVARKNIIQIHKEIAKKGIQSIDIEMKSFRHELINSKKEHHQSLIKFSDFYSLSMLRDLLFHVQEHQFTITKIQDYLSTLGLKFCGFEINNISKKCDINIIEKSDFNNLDKWKDLEKIKPTFFEGMYQFWCQKI